MSLVRVVASLCVVSVLGLVLFWSLDVISGPCSQQNAVDSLGESLHHISTKELSIDTNFDRSEAQKSASAIRCATSPAVQPAEEICAREWEKPSVINEREWEKLWDENTPEVGRKFTPVGVATFLFIQFEAYRGSPNDFSIVGLSPKTLHIYGNPGFECFWVPNSDPGAGEPIQGNATAYLPGTKYATQYTGTVIHCQFEQDVGIDGSGGSLKIVANLGSQDMTGLPSAEFVALVENPGEYDGSLFSEPLKYDYVYCGSPLYGQISPQRVREWVAYHARLFGPRSLIVLYDAGGLHDDVRKVLAPWVKLGRVSITNYRQQARYDLHCHGQVVVLNDCLLQAKRLGQWAFFFDIDEYLYVPSHLSLDVVMKQMLEKGRRAQQVTIDQRPMNSTHCVKRPDNESVEEFQSLWGIEKLVFQRTQITESGGWKDHKYAVQTRYILAADIHDHEYAMYPDGMDKRTTISYVGCEGCIEDFLHYYHFHNTINVREELCKEYVEPWVKETAFNNVTHVFDDSLSSLADAVRQFELETVGSQPYIV